VTERLVVTMPITVEREVRTAQITPRATITRANVPSHFDALRAALIDGRPQPGMAAIWSVPAFDANPGWLAIELRTSLAPGEAVPVGAAFDGGGWGIETRPPNAPARIAVRAGDFIASSASGTITVLQTAPLELKLDLTAASADGKAIRMLGNARFGLERETGPCFT
jgi:hypothetical protein